MSPVPSLADCGVTLLERRHPTGHRGSLIETLLPELQGRGARVTVVHPEEGWHRLDLARGADVVVLKAGSAAALHLAAVHEAWGVPGVNPSDATRLAQDKLASTAILQSAGLPIAPSRFAWLGGDTGLRDGMDAALVAFAQDRVLVKAARGSQGAGLWLIAPGKLECTAADLPPGPYLIMGWTPHEGDDLKVFVAGEWMTALERPFPAKTLEAKRGTPVPLPPEVAAVTQAAGKLLGLSCYGCDFVRGPDGWTLVDVNAFPGYKGADAAAAAIADVIATAASGGGR